ncbi:MAG: cyclic pyranopterin monophosphate synthase MoaC [candidate division Zixibacteria bacterium]
MGKLSHTSSGGRAAMVDVAPKEITHRTAKAKATVKLNEEAFAALSENLAAGGDVLSVARIAGIQAAKKTSELIPLTHHLSMDHIEVEFAVDEQTLSVGIISSASCHSRTGAEMEALTAASLAALTVYDMLKAVQKSIVITDISLLEKTGGKSGDFKR